MLQALAEQESRICWFLDSGAFTAWKSGKSIKLDDYCKFLDSLPLKPWRYFTLDVVGDHLKTMANYREMLKRGYTPMPIFTPGQPLDDLEEYYETSDLVGFGGIATKSSNATRNYIALVMQLAKGRKVHLLGYTSVEWLKIFRPYSCDSSSWNAGSARFGQLALYMGGGRFKTMVRDEFVKKPSQELLRRIEWFGVDPMRLQNAEEWRNTLQGSSAMIQVSVASWVSLAWDIEKNLNTKLFLALGGRQQLSVILYAAQHLQRVV